MIRQHILQKYKIEEAFGFVKRQSNYYRQACEILGLIQSQENRFALTERGKKITIYKSATT
jgi:hypothetical protein